MPTRSHRLYRRSQRRSRLKLLAITTTSAVLLAIVILILARTQTDVTEYANVDSSFGDSHFDQDALINVDVEPVGTQRPNYRYSVIPGGAYNEVELRQAIQNDAIVAAHYARLDQSKLRVERVTHDRYVHVSYRKGKDIFWTKNKVLLRQGETILTDGKTQVRARCGNCISEEPQLPTATDEPDTVEFDRLTDAPRPGETLPVPIAPVAAWSSDPAIAGAVPDDGLADPLAVGRSFIVGAPTPLIASGPTGAGSAPSPAAPGEGTPSPRNVPPPFVGTPGLPGVYDPLPGNDLFPIPPGTPTIPSGFDSLLPPHGSTTEVPPYLTPSGSPGEPGNPVPVPEPGTIFLIGVGVAALFRRLRSRAS